ncbi:HNH endonuclease, partial [Promicromonospora sp. NPDC090134]
RAHHLAKTHHGWNVTRNPDTGTTTWTAPTGHTYTRPPTQVGHVSNDITSLTDDTRHHLRRPVSNSRAGTTSSDGPHYAMSIIKPRLPFLDEPPF